MNFLKTIGANRKVYLHEDSFSKCYSGLDDYHWGRILEASVVLSRHEISPVVLSMTNEGTDYRCIDYQRVTPFLNKYENNYPPTISPTEIRNQVKTLINKMHELGYAHGDLHPGNLGYIGNKIYILDLDTVYSIKEGVTDWLSDWMYDGFTWDGTFEEFIEHDYMVLTTLYE